MKKLFTLLFLIPYLCAAQITSQHLSVIARKNAGGGASYQIVETFDPTGYDNSGIISENGTVDPDYTTTVLEGTQSFHTSTDGSIYIDVTDNPDSFSVYLQMRYTSWVAFDIPLSYLTPPPELDWLLVQTRGDGDLRLYHGSVNSTANLIPNANTTYHIWVDFTFESGGGGNGTAELRVATSSTRPSLADLSITTGDQAKALSKITIGRTSTFIFDRVIYDDSQTIGSAP
jgi:hypothetical protein